MNRRLLRTASIAASLLCLLLILPGCYSRTVSASGMGADQYDISESYQSNGPVDKWLFGDAEKTKKTRTLLNR